HTPFEMLVERLQPYHAADRMPLVQALFVLQNIPRSSPEFTGLTISEVSNEATTAKFDLALFMREGSEGLSGNVVYNTDLFEVDTIATMMGRFEVVLRSSVSNPDISIGELEFYTDADKTKQATHAENVRQKIK